MADLLYICHFPPNFFLVLESTYKTDSDVQIVSNGFCFLCSFQFSSVQKLSHVQLHVTSWTAAHQASLSITNFQSLLKLMSIESVMQSNHLIFCRPLLHQPLIFPSIRVFSSESVLHIKWPQYWSFSIVLSVNIQG